MLVFQVKWFLSRIAKMDIVPFGNRYIPVTWAVWRIRLDSFFSSTMGFSYGGSPDHGIFSMHSSFTFMRSVKLEKLCK